MQRNKNLPLVKVIWISRVSDTLFKNAGGVQVVQEANWILLELERRFDALETDLCMSQIKGWRVVSVK